MPISIQPDDDLQDLMKETWAVRRKVVTIGGEMNTAGWELDFHSHAKAQLLLSLSGIVTCEVEGGIWIVPPQSAIFIPGGMMHRLAIAGKVQCYVTLIEAKASRTLPSTCSTITVSPLLRALILRCAEFPMNYKRGGVESRVADLLLDEIAIAPSGNLHLPMPSDFRLRTIFQNMMANPADRGTIESWARRVGLSERTLARVITAETGMSFGRWRQQLSILLALQWMAGGATVQQTAFDLGYESVGSFVTMFRKALGTSPAHYMSEHSVKR
ncbi:helix-turn-helix domain-containing protein [Granulicella sp. S156]|jgi:AraC-like DNA-binding protein/mannose-6-phosphate isomerase-like protein (cupin superfamily)|uniref:AraC family transcriptional regulator n=1 Tax=Granulicella sp. S156 TaxID=1747224 RepID=UPI0015775743|nr:helix-turn-helix transcriptional regulator [Granulicella sp. S156]